jgi:hypothetical protein
MTATKLLAEDRIQQQRETPQLSDGASKLNDGRSKTNKLLHQKPLE